MTSDVVATSIRTPFGFESTAADVIAGVDLHEKRATSVAVPPASASRPLGRWPARVRR